MFLKILLFILVGFVCFIQLKKVNFEHVSKLHITSPWALFTMILLLPFNYFFEWLKWKAILKTFDTDFGNKTNFQSFMAGIITGMLTPNMQGNFLGRLYYFPRRFRSNIILLTLWSNLGQFIIALVFGVVSLVTIGTTNYLQLSDTVVWWIIAVILALLLFYFSIQRWQLGFQNWKFFQRFKRSLIQYPSVKFELLFWGMLRYLVFSIQFFLTLYAFGGKFSLELFLLVWQIYLWSTLAPSLFLGKLFVRESVALWVLTSSGIGEWNIIFASLTIWIVNLLFPTLVGIVVCKKRTVE